MKEKAPDKKKRNPVVPIVIIIILYAVVVLLLCLFKNLTINKETLIATVKNGTTYMIFGILVGAAGIYFLINWRIAEKRAVMKENDLSDSHWITDKEIEKSKAFTVTSFEELKKLSDGVPFRAKVKGKKNTIIYLKKPIHAAILGTTGSGKTTGYLDPTLQILPQFKTKPCLIVTDPKGELYRHHKANLEKLGYTVSVLDYRNPYQSIKINPFQPVIDRIKVLNNLVVNKKGKYIVDETVYQTYMEADKAGAAKRQEVMDEIYENMQDLIYTLFPVKDGKEPGWEEGARNLIFGICLLFVDDILSGQMPIEKLCLLNIYQTLTLYCTEDMEVLKKYFEEHKENIKAYGLGKTVLITSERTLTSYLSKMMNYISWLADGGIQCMTSGNEISLDTFDQKPNAVFLVFPDEKDGRHVLVSLFIVQTYKALVNRASINLKKGLTKDAELQRNCYFLLDEFGNLPKIHKFDSMTSVGRSRKLFFLCVLQSYSQLDTVYGKDVAEIIKGQLQIKIFLGTDDKKSVEEFSWLCGKKKTYSFSASVGIGREANDTYSAKEKPLITTEELMTINNADDHGNAVISYIGYPPMMTVFTPAYEAPQLYSIGTDAGTLREAEIFDPSKFGYDIATAFPQINFTESELSDEEVAVMEELRAASEKEMSILTAAEAKKNGLLSAIRAKLEFIKDYIPETLYFKLLDGKQKDRAIYIDEFLKTYDGLNTVKYELCYVKTLIGRLETAEADLFKALSKQEQL